MKKIIALIALAASVAGVSAQNAVSSSKFLDNWSVGTDGGISTNLHEWDTPNGGVWGIQLTKGVTPVLSLEFSGQLGFNDDANWNALRSKNAVDNFTVMGSVKVNLMNWFLGYQGQPRLFELQAKGGVGYMGMLYPKTQTTAQHNSTVVKLGLDFDFNLGQEKAWTVSLRPAIVMRGCKEDKKCETGADCGAYSHNALAQLTAGVTYHFKNSNGKHYFTFAPLRSQSEIDSLNAVINNTRALAEKEREQARHALDEKDQQIEGLRKALSDCESREPVKEVSTEKSMECYVYFRQGKSTIDASQQPNVERIATFLKNHSEARVVIFGYASPEGSVEVNERLANQRADAVKNSLINKYGINASRIDAAGKGVGDSFSEPDWNRVSICTIQNEANK
ncbi:MAG: OmpA family protein [Prevotellaceae bacterium]|nr:OmpA family protein [Prevotellaceae bacterium]